MTRRSLSAAALLVLLVGAVAPLTAFAVPAEPARPSLGDVVRPGTRVPVHAGRTSVRPAPIHAPRPDPTKGVKPDGQAEATADIQVTYFGFSAKAQLAFEAAATVWEGLISSSQVIYVDAYWEDLGGGGILGSAGPEWIYRDGSRWYPGPIAEARCACAKNPGGDADIGASFNSSFDAWYLGTDGNPPFGDYDFYTVVLHELGHGLGFLSSFGVQSGLGYWGITLNATRYPMSFDEHQVTAATGGNPLISYANGSSALKNQLTDGAVYFAGDNVLATLGAPAALYAPSPWENGSSNSHFDESTFGTGTQHALMTPRVANAEVIHDPGPLTLALFRDIGWTTVDGPPGDATAPTAGPVTTALFAPQPLGTTVALRVTWPESSDTSGIAAYELQRRKGTGAWANVTLPSPTATEVDVPVTLGSKWSFRVRAIDGANNVGAWSTAVARKLALHQESSPSVSYAGTWTRSALSSSSGGYVRQTAVGGRLARLTFNGTSAAWLTTLGPGRGIAEVWLDGTFVATIDLYAATPVTRNVAWASGALASGAHTLDVVVTGTRNPSATKSRVDVDGFLAWP